MNEREENMNEVEETMNKSEGTMQEEERGKENKFKRIIGIMVSPKETLEAIEKNPSYLPPLLFGIIILLVYIVFTWGAMQSLIVAELEIASQSGAVPLDAETVEMAMVIGMIASSGIIFFGGIAGVFLKSLYCWIASRIVKGEASYKKILSLCLHVMVIALLVYIPLMIMVILGFPLMNYTSLVVFFPVSFQTTWIGAIASNIELFNIWSMVILYYGLRIVAKMSKKAAIITTVLPLVFSIVSTCVAFLF